MFEGLLSIGDVCWLVLEMTKSRWFGGMVCVNMECRLMACSFALLIWDGLRVCVIDLCGEPCDELTVNDSYKNAKAETQGISRIQRREAQ